MWKKALPNVLYNVGIFVCLVVGYQCLESKQYGFLAIAALLLVIFIVLKIRIFKEIRNSFKKP